jgi:predicted nucleotidyltransferase component of viral defense system
MVDINRHRFILVQILKDVYSDFELATCLGLKGGTALMFFYDLPRFSVDLDFNLLDPERETMAYEKIRKIIARYGKIFDEAKKFYGPLIVLDYGYGERKLKVEISNRSFDDHYEIKDLLGISMLVMAPQDMLAHKLCALLDRRTITNRDIFNAWFLMQKQIPVNTAIIDSRMKMDYVDYLQKCIGQLEGMSDKGLLQGIGELRDEETKNFVRTQLRTETIRLMKFYKEFPIRK